MIGIMTRLCSLTMILKPVGVEHTLKTARYTPRSGILLTAAVKSVTPLNQRKPTGLGAKGSNSSPLVGGGTGRASVSSPAKAW
jgi:hypothetical protein